MPTYEYRCRECGEHLEVAQSFKDDPLTTCPKCGGALRKVFGNIGITFKGSGFYKTDSRPAAKSESSSSSASSSSSDGGSTSDTKSSDKKSSEKSSSDSKKSDSKKSDSKKSDSKKSEASAAS